MKNQLLVILVLVCFMSCKNDNTNNKINNNKTENSIIQKNEILPSDLLGIYEGIQPSYFLKNKYGDFVIINGDKLSIPAVNHKFFLNENNLVSLKQVNLDSNNRYYYEGEYKIISIEENVTKIKCSLSDNKTSNQTYLLTIDQNGKKGVCKWDIQPEFTIKKVKNL